MGTPDHTPHGRGYMTATNYFHHDNDYWSMSVGTCPVRTPPSPQPLASCKTMHGGGFCFSSSPDLEGTEGIFTETEGECCDRCGGHPKCEGWAWGKVGFAKGCRKRERERGRGTGRGNATRKKTGTKVDALACARPLLRSSPHISRTNRAPSLGAATSSPRSKSRSRATARRRARTTSVVVLGHVLARPSRSQ